MILEMPNLAGCRTMFRPSLFQSPQRGPRRIEGHTPRNEEHHLRVRGERRDVPSANWLRREIENLQGPRRRDRVYQQDLAKTSGLAQSSISAILSGRRIPDRETVDVLAKGLAVMASELRPGMTLSEQSAYQQAVLVSGLWAAGYNQAAPAGDSR